MSLLHVGFFSEALSMNVDMDVILPQETRGQIGMEGKAGPAYPTLYLLHGMSDDHTIWQRRTSIERYAADKNLAVVMPSGGLSFYTDMYRGEKYWTFISSELPAICRSLFPRMSDKREDTFVAGLSMGGYGALKCGLRASETFSWAAGLSSTTTVHRRAKLTDPARRDYWVDVFGPGDQAEGSFNDLFAAARELAAVNKPKPRLYMWCGTEDGLLGENRQFRDALRALDYDLVYEESPGNHSWVHWDEKIQTVLDWLPIGREEK